MATFQVTVENLQMGSALLSPAMGLDTSLSGGAATGTPVAGAWSTFVEDAERVRQTSRQALGDLSRSLSLAGRAYEIADQSAACSLQVK